MRNEDQTICPNCNIQYGEENPPRLLTMCGHSICEKCIKGLLATKRINGKIKVSCPFDKKYLQIMKVNIGTFPKNLSLLNLSMKKGYHNKSCIIGSSKKQDSQNTFESNSSCIKGKNQSPPKQNGFEVCLLHEKPIELVCMRDYQRICSSCVIFGQHKGHQVKKQSQVESNRQKLVQKFQQLILQETKIFASLSNKQMIFKIQALAETKKHSLQKQIKQKYKELISLIQSKQKQSLNNINSTIKKTQQNLKQSLKQKILLKQQYKDWQTNLKDKLNLMANKKIAQTQTSTQNNHQYQTQKQKLKIIFHSQIFLEQSQKNIKLFKQMYNQFMQQIQKSLNNLVLSFQTKQIIKYIDDHCKIQDATNSFLEINDSKINMMKRTNQESLLDQVQTNLLNICGRQQSILTQNSNNVLNRYYSSNILLGQPQFSKLNKNNSFIKQPRYHKTPNKRSTFFSTKKLSLGTKMLNISQILKTNQIPQKYEQKIQNIIKNKSQVLDLTNCQLGDHKVSTILSIINQTQSQINIIKLVKSKLTDDFLVKNIDYLSNTIMLNISKNQLTQKSLQYILKMRKNGKIKNLRSLMIGQNKIIQRNFNDVIQQLRKLGVNVCI